MKKLTEYILFYAIKLYEKTHLKYEKDKTIIGYNIHPVYKSIPIGMVE